MTTVEQIGFATATGVVVGVGWYGLHLAAWAGGRAAVALVRMCRRGR